MLGTRSAQSAPHPIHPALSSGATHLLLALRVLAIDVEHVRRSLMVLKFQFSSRPLSYPRGPGRSLRAKYPPPQRPLAFAEHNQDDPQLPFSSLFMPPSALPTPSSATSMRQSRADFSFGVYAGLFQPPAAPLTPDEVWNGPCWSKNSPGLRFFLGRWQEGKAVVEWEIHLAGRTRLKSGSFPWLGGG